nr:MAG TPA_asm: hypothetical protein [Caudoviricetes sp.]DAQ34266.1 MAG TPA: hypothetical protein [Caudoviricetes sp.]
MKVLNIRACKTEKSSKRSYGQYTAYERIEWQPL